MYSISYEDNLNPAQLEAVTHKDGPLLVIAGAGSGKTRTLTFRAARLVEDGIPPYQMLLLTFTRKASQEMLDRAAALLDGRCQKISGGTFHSFAHMTLRRFGRRAGVDPEFSIMDRADMENLISIIRQEEKIAPRERSFPRKQTLASPDFPGRKQVYVRGGDGAGGLSPTSHPFLDDVLRLHTLYGQKKREHRFLDYDDLLIYLAKLMKEDDEAAARINDAYRYVMVDEYQDTNLIQADIVEKLAGPSQNITVVGDDAQSIYSFRGATVDNILQFPRRFSGTRVIRLEENYRSIQPILDVTNRIISQAPRQFQKKLFTETRKGSTLCGSAPKTRTPNRFS